LDFKEVLHPQIYTKPVKYFWPVDLVNQPALRRTCNCGNTWPISYFRLPVKGRAP